VKIVNMLQKGLVYLEMDREWILKIFGIGSGIFIFFGIGSEKMKNSGSGSGVIQIQSDFLLIL